MNAPKKPHPSQQSMPLSGDQGLPMVMPILRKKTVFDPQRVCAYMAAVLTGELVMADEQPPAVLQGRKK
ncbi:hypothetical protein [Polynucleobacter sp. es-MAR-4]|uniref:hypothetical protein n=1 Tax=Polynucleobacter sp. es-MAR-4 TaxID=1855655 RepID=UPI001C0C09DF|nr:hypothetical protein [Polynucleobacter sp. es-MAR-4]MBU3637371.1 hypothetical protein [Polynucleobacter sp. es-MAR-4]